MNSSGSGGGGGCILHFTLCVHPTLLFIDPCGHFITIYPHVAYHNHRHTFSNHSYLHKTLVHTICSSANIHTSLPKKDMFYVSYLT